MATACAGVTVTWGGQSLQEVTDIKITAGGALPIGRDSTFALDAGTIEIACLHTANTNVGFTITACGLKNTLAFIGGGLTCSTKAIMQTFNMTGKLNDVARYSAIYKIVRE